MSQWKVEYSFNCDGGEQELNTAISAINAVLPGVEVKGIGTDTYPIRVRVIAPNGSVVWHGKQQSVFKNTRQTGARALSKSKRQSSPIVNNIYVTTHIHMN